MGRKIVLTDKTDGMFEAMLGLTSLPKVRTRKERIIKKKAVAEIVSVRRQAALKAWETRRAQAKKRSDAARKAWKTRRANQEKLP
jgi:hypothetical protein